ncbi:MAG TPA: hypothetical protein VIW29_08520 [Polyangiaceae bacterium]
MTHAARRLLQLVLAGSAALGCASMPTLTERPEDYHLYRAARIAPTEEERLRAAYRYLHEVKGGPHERQLRSWFETAEERYYLAAFAQLPRLYAYEQALPNGPHVVEVRGRIAALEGRARQRRVQLTEEDKRIAATQQRLASADASRRAFVGLFKDWTARLLRIRTFGEPTSELSDETIFAFRLSEPRGTCQGDRCRKLLQPSYEVPGERTLVERGAVLEIELLLESGLLSRARLAGPELWTRLAEALSLTALPSPTPEQRQDAVNRSALLTRALLEPILPASECEVPAQPPVVLERRCRGLHARMLAGESPAQDDVIEVEPAQRLP